MLARPPAREPAICRHVSRSRPAGMLIRRISHTTLARARARTNQESGPANGGPKHIGSPAQRNPGGVLSCSGNPVARRGSFRWMLGLGWLLAPSIPAADKRVAARRMIAEAEHAG